MKYKESNNRVGLFIYIDKLKKQNDRLKQELFDVAEYATKLSQNQTDIFMLDGVDLRQLKDAQILKLLEIEREKLNEIN